MARHNHGVAGTGDDPTIYFAELKLEGREYKLAFDFNAIAEAESVTKSNLLSGLENLGDLSATQLRGLLYASLHIAHPDLTVEDVGAMIQPFNTRKRKQTISAITNAMAEAYGLSTPEPKQDPTAADVPPAGNES